MQGGDRIDDTPVHKALREVLANCLVNTDFFVPRGIVIKQEDDKIILENPGAIRVGKYQMKLGGESDPRNKALMKMFNMIDIGERAGSGVPELFSVWENEGWEEPVIEERLEGVERTRLILSFKKKSVDKKPLIKTADKKPLIKTADKKYSKKTKEQFELVLAYMDSDVWYRAMDFVEILGVKDSRLRDLFKDMVAAGLVEDNGVNRWKKYKKVEK